MSEHQPIDSTAPIEGERVGGFLRSWREQRGLSLDEASRALRIRLVHLEAIEDGRYSALPAKPYVIGFVRAYAELLGVDSEAVLRRLRAEMAHLPDQQRLVFPEAVSERTIPGGALASLSICALIAIYAAWYYQTAQHHIRQDVAAPPAPLAEPVIEPPARQDSLAFATPDAATVAIPVLPPARPDASVGVSGPISRAPGAPDALPGTAPIQPGAVPDGRRPPGGAGTPSATLPPVGAAPGLTAWTPVPVGQGWPGQRPQIPVADAAGQGVAPPPLPAPAMVAGRSEPLQPAPVTRSAASVQAAEVPDNGLNLAAVAAAGPILLRAVEPSWIEVRSSSGEVIHGRLLKAGDSYAVPQRPDLRLTTGNAGGLEVTVGGEAAPRLGPRGAVIRDIALDGARLLAGTATTRN